MHKRSHSPDACSAIRWYVHYVCPLLRDYVMFVLRRNVPYAVSICRREPVTYVGNWCAAIAASA
ncbi:MAG: hypothetical protein ACFFED_02335 [Candidatus Thorarchaeota archaeon]